MDINKKIIENTFFEHANVIEKTLKKCEKNIKTASEIIFEALKNRKKILIFGNGGSAADAQHLAAEFVCRFVRERKGFPAIALTTDTSNLTAIGNDYGFNKIFARQIEALANKGDVCLGISTSGNSSNVHEGFQMAESKGCRLVSLLGRDGGSIKNFNGINIIIPSNNTARIQEMHILIGHIFCAIIDNIE